MKRPLLAAAIAILAAAVSAQTSEHQRLGVRRDTLLEFSPSCALSIQSFETAEGLELELRPDFGLELLVDSRFMLAADIPALAILPLNQASSLPPRAALADPSLLLGYTFRSGGWRASIELSYRHPLGVWESYEAEARALSSGSGYRSLGLALSATRYLDPLALGFRLSAETGLPRPERFGDSRRPLDLALALFATEALNDLVALTASAQSDCGLPTLADGQSEQGGSSYALSVSVGLVISLGDTTLRASIGRELSRSEMPGRISFGVSRNFRVKGGRQ